MLSGPSYGSFYYTSGMPFYKRRAQKRLMQNENGHLSQRESWRNEFSARWIDSSEYGNDYELVYPNCVFVH